MDVDRISREEKLAFFISLYNMMVIHAILTWGHPTVVADIKKFLGEFKYVVGGCPYSLSAILNGVLRSNQRPPYNLFKPFEPKDMRFPVKPNSLCFKISYVRLLPAVLLCSLVVPHHNTD